jgi:fibronectin type 3 domain-containing protein
VEYSVGVANTLTQGIGVGDVTGDGRNDVVATYGGNRPAARVAVFAQKADGTLAAPVAYPSYDIPQPVEVADFNHDGVGDVVTLHTEWFEAGLYRGAAGGALGSEELYEIPGGDFLPHGLAVGDLNGDGWPDVAFADNNGFLGILRNAAGRPPLPPAAPGPPTLLSATTGDGFVSLAWRAPDSTGGSAVTGYDIYRGTSSGGEKLVATTGPYSTYSDTGLANGTRYFYRVTAVNVAGEGSLSNELSAVPGPLTAPSAPVLASATAGVTSVDIAWTAPTSDGGSVVTSYNIYRGTSSGTEILLTTRSAATSTLTDSNTAPGATYYYEVTAVNGIGESARSNERSAALPNVPNAPALVSATALGGSVALAWNAPGSDGGSGITGYALYRGTASGAETLLTRLGNVGSYTDTTGTSGTAYYYTVSATNAVGDGARSNELTATPDATPPSQPTSLKLAVAGTNQLALDWRASTDNVRVSGYQLYRNGVLAASVTTTEYLDSGLAAGATYTYSVRAIDAAGNVSPSSTVLNAKTLGASTGKTGTLAGAVYNAGGDPLANATVTLTIGRTSKTAKTNSGGVWKITNLPPGVYNATFSLAGYGTQTGSLTAAAGKTNLAATALLQQ